MNREQIHATFVRLFAQPAPRRVITVIELDRVESDLGITFPQSYCGFVTTFGAVQTPALLDLVTGGESECPPDGAGHDILQFIEGKDLVEVARKSWAAGMSAALVPIAMDCMGSLFGFKREVENLRPLDSAVLFFDHEFVKVSEEASSFDGWLQSFIDLQAQVSISGKEENS